MKNQQENNIQIDINSIILVYLLSIVLLSIDVRASTGEPCSGTGRTLRSLRCAATLRSLSTLAKLGHELDPDEAVTQVGCENKFIIYII